MTQPPSFREELISQIPALRLLMAMGYQYLTPDEALSLRGGKKGNVILEGVHGQGHYVGTVLGWNQFSNGWWGEGEIKFFMDSDGEFPTICGTGTEDYFGGAWGFDGTDYSAPYLGFLQVRGKSQQTGTRMTMYRFHVLDPVFFSSDLRVTMQAIGWRSKGRFLPLLDDIASVVYWYQTLPTAPFPELPDQNGREII